MATIKVEGYSGCPIRVIHSDEHGTVLEKSTHSASYVPRLLKQMEKQVAFESINKIPRVFTPRVLYHHKLHVCSGKNEVVQEAMIAMKFEHHTDVISFLDRANLEKIERLGNVLLEVVQQYIDISPISPVPKDVFTSKFLDVEKNLRKNSTISSDQLDLSVRIIRDLIAFLPSEVLIPIGACHGDLTMSNVLLQECHNKIILIDFLDAFVESPLADIAKLRQDLKYGWTLRLYREPFDAIKITNIFHRFDSMLMKRFGALEWVSKYLDVMFILNQFRVLQYCKDVSTASYLLSTITPEYAVFKEKQRPSSL